MSKLYPKYAPSEVPWIGEVPEHWQMKPAGSVLRLKRELVGKNSADFPLLSLTLRGVILRDLTENKGKFPAEFDTYQAVEPGDLVFCLFDVAETPRTVGMAHTRGMITGAYDVFEPSAALDGRFMEYLYLSVDQPKALSYYYSGLRKVIRMPTFKIIKWPIPPLEEQRAIADYLDRETARIDTLIEEQQRLIEMLEERRRAAIAAAFARDSDARLRNAIEVAQTGPFGTQLSANEYVEDGIPVINPSHIKRGGIEPDPSVAVGQNKAAELGRWQMRLGDIVLGRKGEVDKSALVGEREAGCICGSDSMLLRPSPSTDPAYLWWFFQSPECHSQLEQWSVGATVAGLNQTTISKIVLPLPPLDEQRLIVAYLDEQTATIDTLIAETDTFIELSRERRSALITAAVTGQIDVREAV